MFCLEGDHGSIQLGVNRELSVMEGIRSDTSHGNTLAGSFAYLMWRTTFVESFRAKTLW